MPRRSGKCVFGFLRALLASAFAAVLASGAPAAAQSYGGGLVNSATVTFINQSSRALYVAFSLPSGSPGPVVWSSDCARFNNEVLVERGRACQASIPYGAGPARFCASENPEPAGRSPNCYGAQRSNETIIEANFTIGSSCYSRSQQEGCVWYDISVAPQGCTNCDWNANNCNGAGGPAYNVSVQLSCRGAPTFTCRGPIGVIGGYGAQYPVNCGTPFNQPTCIGSSSAACLQAYFFPMSTSGACPYPTNRPQPIGQCQQGETLFVTFPNSQ